MDHDGLSEIRTRRPPRHGKLVVTKRGVYMIRGDSKLKNIQLISWEQLLCTGKQKIPGNRLPDRRGSGPI
jgi:hypothetical protein